MTTDWAKMPDYMIKNVARGEVVGRKLKKIKAEKRGWWNVKFDITLDGEGICFDDLSEESQTHICQLIQEGFTSGELCEYE